MARRFATSACRWASRLKAASVAVLLTLVAQCAFAQPMWPAQKILSQFSGSTITYKDKSGAVADRFDREAVAKSQAVLERLAPAYEMATPPLFVTPAKSPNAFATVTKDGHSIVAINTAMLRLAGHDENALAVVMGHELGHLKARHATEGAQRARTVSVLAALLGAAVDMNQARHGRDTHGMGQVIAGAGGALLNAKFSRDQEREADRLGLTAMAKAGFDPSSAPGFWNLMASAGGGGNGTWMDSHPSSGERQQTLAALAVQLQPVYAQNANRNAAVVAAAGGGAQRQSAFFEPTPDEISVQSAYARGRAAFKEKRYPEAHDLLAQSAAGEDPRALALLGEQARTGLGREIDLGEARDYFERAAARGFAPAMTMLADMSASGRGRPKDDAEAARLFALAAERGEPRAAARLALMHLSGSGGLAKDAARARQLAQQSDAQGDSLGRTVLAVFIRDGVAGPADPARGSQMLQELAPKEALARFQLGYSFEKGLGMPADRGRAASLYEQAAQAGVTAARQRLNALGAQ